MKKKDRRSGLYAAVFLMLLLAWGCNGAKERGETEGIAPQEKETMAEQKERSFEDTAEKEADFEDTAGKEADFENTAGREADSEKRAGTEQESNFATEPIEEQQFEIEVKAYGTVTFTAYAPDTSISPYSDLVFRLLQDGSSVYVFPFVEENIRQDHLVFQELLAVSFPDLNGDGNVDVVTIAEYDYQGVSYTKARIFTGKRNGQFLEQTLLEEAYNEAHNQKTVADVIEFTAREENQEYFANTSIYGGWKVTEVYPTNGISGLSEEEAAGYIGTELEYGRAYFWSDQIGSTRVIENYQKQLVSVQEFEKEFPGAIRLDYTAMAYQFYELEGIEDAPFGTFAYLVNANKLCIYYEGRFFRAVRM